MSTLSLVGSDLVSFLQNATVSSCQLMNLLNLCYTDGGEDSPNDIARGMFAGHVETMRLLRLFKKYNLTVSSLQCPSSSPRLGRDAYDCLIAQTTWFIPGHSLDSFPEEMAAVRDAGHEIGLHGYSHENPIAMTFDQQKEVLDHTFKVASFGCET